MIIRHFCNLQFPGNIFLVFAHKKKLFFNQLFNLNRIYYILETNQSSL